MTPSDKSDPISSADLRVTAKALRAHKNHQQKHSRGASDLPMRERLARTFDAIADAKDAERGR